MPLGLRFHPGIAGVPNTATVDIGLLAGHLSSGWISVEVTQAGWGERRRVDTSIQVGELDGPADLAVPIDLTPRPSPGRCGPTAQDTTTERFIVRVLADTAERAAGLADNNAREITATLSCHAPNEAIGLGPFPDPAIAAVQPYVAHEDGADFLRFFVSLHNRGTPVRVDSIHIDLSVGERSWIPGSWRDGATGVYHLDPSVVHEPLNGLPPRRAHACGLGGKRLPLGELPDFATTYTPGRKVGTDNSVPFVVELSLSQPVRQRDVDNDRFQVVVPLDRGLPDVADTPCGGRPERFGIEQARLQSLLPGHPAAAPASPAVRVTTEPQPDGSVEIRGEIWQTVPGPAVAVPYTWLRNGTWAGGGWVDLPADAPAVVRAREAPNRSATWELRVDPAGILPGDRPADNRAIVTVTPSQ
ncbi:MAG: hypothetical protein D6798_16780 [Deltaproteobacteria bacterium]|nr:MAG: hypothetical protein D6798_16780 [Deltaproteobacteria bacterium]